MFENAVVGVDVSPGGEALLATLPALEALGTRRLTLVHAVEPVYPTPVPEDPGNRHREPLERAVERARAAGFEASGRLVLDDPARAIRSVAAEERASLIVVGSRGHSRVAEAFVGSVAWGVVQRAETPVLLQRIFPVDGPTGSTEMDASPAFERVIFPTDWSDTAGHALEKVESIARQGRIDSYLLMHVRSEIEEAHTGKSTEAEHLARLEEIGARLRYMGAREVAFESPSGGVFDEIVRRADALPGTLIVMGTHGRGVVADAVIGGVSRDVVRRARSSVLLVNPRA